MVRSLNAGHNKSKFLWPVETIPGDRPSSTGTTSQKEP